MNAILSPLSFILLAASPVPPADGEIAGRLAERLERLAAERRFSGELRLSRGGRVIAHRGFGGVAVVAPSDPRGAAIYIIASMTKTFTAASLLLLAQRGRLRLEDPLAKYFPELDAQRLTKDGRPVTLDDLATHTSGLAGVGLRPHWADDHPPDAVSRMLAESSLSTTPGQAYAYSNTGYVVLGEVLRRVSDQSYDQFVRQQIAGPLGLVDTGIVLGADQRRRLLPGQIGSEVGLHSARGLLPHRLREGYEWPGAAAGGLRSTAADLDQFFTALVTGKLLERPWLERMMTVKLDEYARGLVISSGGKLGRRLVWHNGEVTPLGYQSFAAVIDGPGPGEPLVLVALANVDSSAMDLTTEVLDSLAGRSPRALERWTYERTLNTLRFLRLPPLAAVLSLLVLSLQLRRPARPRAHTLAVASGLLPIVVVGLADERSALFIAGCLLWLVLTVALLFRRPPRPFRWSDPAFWTGALALLLALPLLALVALMRA